MNKWKKFTAACMGAAMVGTTAFGSSTVFADDTVTLDVWHQFTDPESAAVKSDVTGQCNHNFRIFWMLCKIRCNLPASVFIQEILSRKSYSINHPSGPYNQVCTSDSFSPFQSQSSNAAHTYSEKCNVLLFLKAITLDQHMSAFL